MKYPSFLKEHDEIGVTALSDGVTDTLKQIRLKNAYKQLSKRGFSITATPNVTKSEKGRSTDATIRAKEFHDLIKNPDIKTIIFASGGDFLLETLPYIDFSIIEQNPKWIQGYSDPTGILFTITTKLDMATIYGNNISAFGMEAWHQSLNDNLSILCGKKLEQHSYSYYEKESLPYETGLEGYHLDTPVKWKSLFQKKIHLEGRMIGGCIDLLSELVGTPYDYVSSFINKYQNDGIIWFFDNCELSNDDLIRVLWKFKVCGWFLHTKAILFGRSARDFSYYQISFEETLKDALGSLNIPILYDMDFGHIAPRMTIINGGYAEIDYEDGKGSITFECK